MNMLCLVRNAPDATARGILEVLKREHAVTVVDLRTDKDYDKIVKLVLTSDSVLSW
jgi:crotonobetainyl-CoA:carnitine CoA-transferase CaiB-like acyl-CoA transferase